MRNALFAVFCAFFPQPCAFAQNVFEAVVKDAETRAPLPGSSAIVQGTRVGGTADENGVVRIDDVPEGAQKITFSFVGYRPVVMTVIFPRQSQAPLEVLLHPAGEALDEIIISSTRSSRTIEDLPTRVELIAGEELDEKGNMKPGDIRMLLNESTGIQTQQTSPTSANASIRIQGLDGRYTQILKDGFPLYAGFSGGLGLLQTPPLDLRQVEVIKGATSRLSDNTYGEDYWICGLMMEKIWEQFSVFLNFENFLDARQTRFDTIYTGSITNPVFRDIYAPVDGFVVNGGLKVAL